MKVVNVLLYIDASFIKQIVLVVIIAFSFKIFLQVVTIENAQSSDPNQANDNNNHKLDQIQPSENQT